MGCGSSSADAASPNEVVSRAAAQSFFNLDGLPLSLTVVPVDKKCLQLRVVGLDCVEEMYLLERAFQKRELLLIKATLLRIGLHVDQTFELMQKGAKPHTPVKNFMSPQRPKANYVKLEEVSAESAQTEVPDAEAAIKGVKADRLFKLSIQCTIKGYERGVVAETMKKLKHRLVCATLKSEAYGQEAQDVYWMIPDPESTTTHRSEDLVSDFKFALFEQEQKLKASTSMKKRKSASSPVKGSSSLPDQDVGRMESIGVVEQINRRKPVHQVVLPIALQEKQRELEYQIQPSQVGLVVGGFKKYVGIGLVQRSLRSCLGYKDAAGETLPLVLELRSFFMSEKQAESHGHIAMMQHMVHNAMGSTDFAHFVTWLDIASRTWTIDRVFLNGVLPNGKSYGAKAIAEHLLAPPHLFFPKEQGTETPTWMASFMESVPDLEKLVVSDIINWNTYMLMAVVGSKERNAEAKIGDVLQYALQTELTHAKMTKDQLYQWPVLEVFQRTVLGKMCVSVLKQCNDKLKMDVKMESAEVTFGEGDEQIFGQRRPRMAVIVQLSRSHADAISRRKTRLENASESTGHAVDLVHMTRDESQTQRTKQLNSRVKKEGIADVEPNFQHWGGLMTVNKVGSNASLASLNVEKLLKSGPSTASLEEHQKLEAADIGLEGVGQNLETNFETGPNMTAKQSMVRERAKHATPKQSAEVLKHGAGQNPGLAAIITSGRIFMVGVSSAMTCLLHELQCERGLSCRATAAASEEEGPKAAIAKERLRLQRLNTDKAFGQLLDFLKIAASLYEKGTIEYRHKAVLDLQQQISVGVMVQRGLVDDAIVHGVPSWMGRYLTVCTSGETGYHVLTGKLLRGIVKAIQFATECIDDKDMQESCVHKCSILLRCKEQAGQERALIAAKGSSRWMEQWKGREIFDAVRAGSQKLEHFVTKDEMQWQSSTPKSMILDVLKEMWEGYDKEVSEPSYSIPPQRVVVWFEALTNWIDAAYDQIQEEIQMLTEQMPENYSVAQPAPPVSLRANPMSEVVGNESGDEDVQLLISELRAGKFSRIVIMAGAGISVSANLPDFRSPGGLYDQLRKTTNITAPETIFTGEFLNSNPELFFEVVKKLQTDHVKPTLTHCFIKLLQERQLMRRCYTQNIDCLERKAGIPEKLLVECHGTTASARCNVCQKQYTKEEFFSWDAQATGSKVPRCSVCKGLLRPDIVLFGEKLAGGFQEKSTDDFKDADLVIIMGTSLQVQPFASLPKMVKANCAMLVFNRELPSSLRIHRQVRGFRTTLTGSKLRNHVFLQGDCDTSIRWLTKELGWADELETLFANRSL
mmetsp:Transcript_56231/g.131710  ORF Transcript_56231/g.131710 Transcript_56231/m.131710 type:complete len:1318 (-) Transcript_56231:144-4097(-)